MKKASYACWHKRRQDRGSTLISRFGLDAANGTIPPLPDALSPIFCARTFSQRSRLSGKKE